MKIKHNDRREWRGRGREEDRIEEEMRRGEEKRR